MKSRLGSAAGSSVLRQVFDLLHAVLQKPRQEEHERGLGNL